MSTKNNPGQYDCYAKLDPDEPYFLFRAKDPSAAYLIRIWVALRNGEWIEAMSILIAAMSDMYVQERVSPERYDKLDEAVNVSVEMQNWHQSNVVTSSSKT